MISPQQYVDITSGVGGQAQAANRDLGLRLFTSSAVMPAGTVSQFTSAEAVGARFGYSSPEYQAAALYFGYVNNYQQKPKLISFYANSAGGAAPFILSAQSPAPLASFQAVKDGAFTLTMGGVSAEIQGLDFSSATSYADIAADIQTAVRAAQTANALWNEAAVSFLSVPFGSFAIYGGEAGASGISALSSPNTGGTDISGMLGLNEAAAPIVSQGAAASSLAEVLDASLALSNNYGTFAFLSELTQEEIVQIAQWTHGKNHYGGMYLQSVKRADAAAVAAATAEYDGVALISEGVNGTGSAYLVPAAVAASTNYNRVNGTQNFMYKQLAGVTPTVTTDAEFAALSAFKVNFYGSTQSAGVPVSFFQPGLLQGSVDDMGVFVNEIWLKDSATVSFLNYQLSVSKWPANASGKAIGDGILQNVINTAKLNGTILQGKDLTAAQKAYITNLTGNEDAWRAVYSEGDYLDSQLVPVTQNGATVYQYQYTLIYSKGDSVRKVTGTHTLI